MLEHASEAFSVGMVRCMAREDSRPLYILPLTLADELVTNA